MTADSSAIGLASAMVLLAGLLGSVLSLAVYDVIIYRKFGVEATISRGMQRLGYAAPIFAFAVGILVGLLVGVMAGHFWWSQPPVTP